MQIHPGKPAAWSGVAWSALLLSCVVGCQGGEPPAPVGAAAAAPADAPLSLELPGSAPAALAIAHAAEEAPESESSRSESAAEAAPDLSRGKPEEVRVSEAGTTPATKRTGEDWPRFLGPRDNGISGETGLLEKWPEAGPPIVWEMRVGTGYSAPSVRGHRLVVHHRVKDEEVIECLAADTGAPLWKHASPTRFEDPYGYNNGPRCSPLLTADRCYTFGAEGRLVCVKLDTGELVWERKTGSDFDVPDAFFGVGSSPILVGKLLIVMVGGEPRSGIVAFHADTGETVWESVGKTTWTVPRTGFDIDDKLASYASLTYAEFHGTRHVLALMRDGLVSVDPKDGRIHFSYFFRSRSFESVNAARPLVFDDKILISAAYRTGAALLQVQPGGDRVAEVWRNLNLQTHWSTTIHHKGHLFGFSGRHEPEGTLRCLSAETGEVKWETEGVTGDVQVSPKDGLGSIESRYYGRGSAILADGKFIVLGERGLLALVKADPEKFEEVSRIKFKQMKYPSWAAPVLSRGRLYLRCEDALLCLDLARPKAQ